MPIRPFQSCDLSALLGINQASIPGVSSETEETLLQWIALSTCLVAVEDSGAPVGFATIMELGLRAYDSPNMRWFEARQAAEGGDLVYVDRICLDPTARGKGIGSALYRHAFSAFAERGEMGCEVNIVPPNPGSQRFHTRMGFQQIGERAYGDAGNAVGYWVRRLGGA